MINWSKEAPIVGTLHLSSILFEEHFDRSLHCTSSPFHYHPFKLVLFEEHFDRSLHCTLSIMSFIIFIALISQGYLGAVSGQCSSPSSAHCDTYSFTNKVCTTCKSGQGSCRTSSYYNSCEVRNIVCLFAVVVFLFRDTFFIDWCGI